MESINYLIQSTTIPNLYLISSGTNIPNPTELLISEITGKLLDQLEKRFQYIIIDTPPVEFIPDAFVINNYVHGMIFVVRYGKSDLNKLNKKIQEFSALRDDIIGLVLNGFQDLVKKNYHSYSYYKY